MKLQYFGHLMRRVDSLEKTLMLGLWAGGEGEDRGWDGWMASPTGCTWVWVNSGSWLMDSEAWRAAIHGVAKGRTRLSDWTDLNWHLYNIKYSYPWKQHDSPFRPSLWPLKSNSNIFSTKAKCVFVSGYFVFVDITNTLFSIYHIF